MAKTLHFHSREAYRKYIAYGHIHGAFTEKVQPRIVIAGKPHHVNHCEACGSKMHHTHSHHLHVPQHSMHHSRHHSKHHSTSSEEMRERGVGYPKVKLLDGLGKIYPNVGKKYSVMNIKFPKIV